MPRASSDKAYVNFIKGLITEANPLAFPEGAAIDLDNVDLSSDGSISRRKGADFETDYRNLDVGDQQYMNYNALSVHRWRAVAGDGELDFIVVQIGDKLDVYTASSVPLSNGLVTSIDVSSAALSRARGKESILQSAYGKGRLFMTGKGYNPFYVQYDKTADKFSIAITTIKIRDFDRLDDGFDIDERPTVSNKEHNYNLKNQGWTDAHIATYDPPTPSNAQIWHVAKNTTDDFTPSKLDKIAFGNTAAPNGHFILEAFRRDRTSLSGVAGFGIEVEANRPEAVAFFAGRVWYAGIDSETLNGHILFSQILEELQLSNAGKCYQEQDPTAEEFNELLDTDGGAIIIPEAGEVYKIIPLNSSMVVIASNGIWQITGSDSGFNASSYSVNKLSEFGAASAGSAVQAESIVLYWSRGSIYSVGPDPQTINGLIVEDISKNTIRTFYLDIPDRSKTTMASYYDNTAKRVHWLYNDSLAYTGFLYKYNFNKVLTLDLSVMEPAFTKYSLPYGEGTIPGIAAFFFHKNELLTRVSNNVVVNGDNVQVSGDQVVINEVTGVEVLDNLELLVTYKIGANYFYTFGQFKNRLFKDWVTAGNAIGFDSFIQTGFENLGDLMRDKQPLYVYSYFKRTESEIISGTPTSPVYDRPSGATLQGRWAWSDNLTSDKWTIPQAAYKLDRGYNRLRNTVSSNNALGSGFSLVNSRLKMRGSGKSLSVKYTSVPEKDFVLMGWSIPYTAGAAFR